MFVSGRLDGDDLETEVGRLVGEVYALAAEPTEWDRFLDAMEAERAVDGRRQAQLAALVSGAERVAVLAASAEPADVLAPVAVLALSAAGQRIAANGMVARSVLADLTDDALADILVEARARLARDGDQPVVVNLAASSEAVAAFAYVAPMACLPPELLVGLPPTADGLALVAPLSVSGGPFWAGFGKAFGLTPAELRLAARLHEGDSLREAATALRLSVHTVRNQLRSVFHKTGVNRQADLTRAMAELATVPAPAPARGPAAESRDDDTPSVRSVRLADGRKLAYRAYGDPDGRAVLVFHAGVGASLLPIGTDSRCRELGLRLVAPERPGIGQSTPRAVYSLDGVADDLAALTQQLGLGRCDLCSFTSGARFALALANRWPDRVGRILMLSPRPPQTAEARAATPSPLVRFQRRILAHPWLADAVFAAVRMRLTRRLVEKLMRASALGAGDQAFLDARPDMVDLMTAAAREAMALTGRGTAAEMQLSGDDAARPGPHLVAPITVWRGAEDTYVSTADLQTWLGGRLGDLRTVPGIGNYLIRQQWGAALAWLAA